MTTPTPRWTADLRVKYDRPETVAEMLDWLVDSDPIELRDVALNLLHDVETLKVVLTTLADAGVLTAVGGETRQEWGVDVVAYVGRPFPTRAAAEAEIAERRELGRTYPGKLQQRTVHLGPWREVTDDPA